MDPAEFYRDAYVALAAGHGYDPACEPTFAARVGSAIESLAPPPKRLLDFGCGSGEAVQRFIAAGHNAVGVDISASGIGLARIKVPEGRFEWVGTDGRLPFERDAFDACYASEVIEHLLDVKGFLRELNRVLVPGGLLLLTTPYHGWLKNLLIVTFAFEKHFNPYSGHIRFFSRRSLTEVLRSAGFRAERFKGLGRCPLLRKTLFVAARKAGAPAR